MARESPDHWLERLERASAQAQDGETSEALTALRALLADVEKAGAGGTPFHFRALETLVALDPADARSLAALGQALLRRGDAPGAIRRLLTAFRLDSQDPSILRALSRAFLADGAPDRAAGALLDLVPLYRLRLTAGGTGADRGVAVHRRLNALREGLRDASFLSVAVPEIEALLARNPLVAEAWALRAEILARAGNGDDAAESVAVAIAIAIACDDQHRPRLFLDEALRRNPEHPLLLALAPRVRGA